MATTERGLTEKKLTASEAFTLKITNEFSSGVGDIALTNFQKRLVGNYFMSLDSVLKTAEEKRLKKSDQYRDPVPVTWENVNMQKLARDVVACARIGFDPAQKNHINMVPFKNGTTNKYDVTFIEGYRGLELKASKYGLQAPDAVVVEVVYSTDHFRSIKRDARNPYENYEFEVTNDFDRGEIVGGFYYHVYNDHPEKNKLVVMPIKEIEKRKPQYASTEFWGGEKPVYQNGKKTGETERVEGWYEKMVWKTLYRAAYADITIDSQKIDDDYLHLSRIEDEADKANVDEEIHQNANKQTIDIPYNVSGDADTASDTAHEAPEETPLKKAAAPF